MTTSIRDAARAEVAKNAGPLPPDQLAALAAVWLPAEQAARERQAAERAEAMSTAENRPQSPSAGTGGSAGR